MNVVISRHTLHDEMLLIGFCQQEFGAFVPNEIKQLCHMFWGSNELSKADAIRYQKEIHSLTIQKAHSIAQSKHNESDEWLTFGYVRETTAIWDDLYISSGIQRICHLFVGSMATNLSETIATLVTGLQNEIVVETQAINKRTECVEEELSEAKPAVEAAQKAVSMINRKQLCEIRALKRPPQVCEMVLFAVALMLKKKVRDWRRAQRMLGDRRFIPNVLRFDTHKLNHKTMKKVRKLYLSNPDFNFERVNKASKVCGPLVLWVQSQVKFGHLLDSVEPMTREIKELESKLSVKQKQCDEYNTALTKLKSL